MPTSVSGPCNAIDSFLVTHVIPWSITQVKGEIRISDTEFFGGSAHALIIPESGGRRRRAQWELFVISDVYVAIVSETRRFRDKRASCEDHIDGPVSVCKP